MRLSLASLLLLGALAVPAHAQTTAPTPNPFGPGAAKPTQAPPPNPPAIPAKPAAQVPANSAPANSAPASPAPAGQHAPAAGVIYPTAIAPKYAKEPAGTARQHTCLDQYNANKAAGGAGNGGLNWIEKGGGYYSECNKRLKG
ncbi:hypothetical protein VQ02_27365 [Methylobacterium variabile]|jgi:hypothetical protein|uniref:Uncharacterized protein n=1 Tax=Methylobacterium variabile TaxID=298794 RepID=A0A0J6UX16_9HYPH|nr:hypothetical protein [Methylobacterium variabile]KMO30846.1 hypothetical protein VQ02_27365 [Methylobacterium variabile]